MNKSTKIRLNYLFGATISVILLWSIGHQLQYQLKKADWTIWQHRGPAIYGILCVILFFFNIGIEAKKWHLLASLAELTSYLQALRSVLCGIAFSLITPNRIGEYPGRMIALEQKNTPRLISVSALGAFAQMIALFSFGLLGLIYYNIEFPGQFPLLALIGTVLLILFLTIFYRRYEWWSSKLESIKWFRKYKVYGYLLRNFSTEKQLIIIGLSLLRFGIFTAQYLLLLLWLNVQVPIISGYCLSALFFWAMAIIPTISLAEVGIRAQVGLFLFQRYSDNTIGILSATFGLWCINLVIPAIIGSLLIGRTRLIR